MASWKLTPLFVIGDKMDTGDFGCVLPTAGFLAMALRLFYVLLVVLLVGYGFAEAEEAARAAEPVSDASGEGVVKIFENQRYCDSEGRAGLCDVYLPSQSPPPSGYPVVLVVHGGGWISGDKWTLEGYSRLLAENGLATVTINYRLAPDHKFPAQLDDVRSALVWTRENAARFSIDVGRLGLFGYSAGGHLATLIASLADEPLAVQRAASAWDESHHGWSKLPAIRAVCAGGPPSDFRSLPKDNQSLAYFLGGSRRQRPEIYRLASPAAHVSGNDPVTQLIQGEDDILVPVQATRTFHQCLLSAGVDSRLEVMPNQGHLVTFLDPKTSELLVKFLHEVL